MELLEKFKDDLNKAKKKNLALKKFQRDCFKISLRNVLTEGELIAYWKKCLLCLGEEHKKGFLSYSESYRKKWGPI